MNSKERFYAAMRYKEPDRLPAVYHGTPEIDVKLMEFFNAENMDGLLQHIGDDFRYVEPEYIGPESICYDYYGSKDKIDENGTWEGIWGERYKLVDFGTGAYPEAVFLPYKDITDVDMLSKIRIPSPDWFDYSNIKSECERLKNYVVVTRNAAVPDFMNGIARCRGVEQVLYDVALEDPVFLEIMRIRFDYFYERYKRVLDAGDGEIDILYLGEDLGNQNGLMISPLSYDRLFAPYMEKLFKLGHSYGAKTMMHCCGSCRELIHRLIELGLDILQVIQTDAANMDIESLYKDFYGKIVFNGSISVQSTLPFGSKEDVIREVEVRKKLFGNGGMIIGPTHQIQAGTPIENIIAMYKAIGSLKKGGMKMTSRERVLKALRRQGIPDRPPFEISWGAFTPGLMKVFREKTGTDLSPEEYFDFDVRWVNAGITNKKTDFNRYFKEAVPQNVLFNEWGVGAVCGRVEHFMEIKWHPLLNSESVEDIHAFEWPDIISEYRYETAAKEIKAYKERGYPVAGDMYATIFETAWQLRGMEKLLIDFCTNEEIASAICNKLGELRARQAAIYAMLGVDIIRLGDDVATQNGLMMSVDMYRRFLKGPTKRVIDAAKAENPDILVFMHCDGKVGDLIQEFIDIGVDILNPVQPECNDLDRIKTLYGRKISLWGGIGTQSVMPFGNVQEVKDSVRKVIQVLGKDGGFLLAPAHILEPEVPWENVMAFIEEARNARYKTYL